MSISNERLAEIEARLATGVGWVNPINSTDVDLRDLIATVREQRLEIEQLSDPRRHPDAIAGRVARDTLGVIAAERDLARTALERAEALAEEWERVEVVDEWDAADRWADAPRDLRAALESGEAS